MRLRRTPVHEDGWCFANTTTDELQLMFDRGDITRSRIGEAYLEKVLGTDAEALRAASPVNNADKLKAPVMLIHGAQDKRAPLAHAEALKAALLAQGREVEWIVEPREGHGFFDQQTRERTYQRLLHFLEAHTAAAP